jgi:hypothetical protein
VDGVDSYLDRAIGKALASIRERGVGPHVHSPKCRRLLSHVLVQDEKIMFEAKQSRMESAAPIRVVATDRRVIIAKPSYWGFYFGLDLISPTNYTIIPYKYIIGVTLSRGKLLTTMKIHTSGGIDKDLRRGEENEIRGVKTNDASLMALFIEEVVEYKEEESDLQSLKGLEKRFKIQPRGQSAESLVSLAEAKKMVTEKGSRFVWLGVEPVEEVAKVLGVDAESVTHANQDTIAQYGEGRARELTTSVLVSYDDIMSSHLCGLLKKRFGINVHALRGGIRGVASGMTKDADKFL